MGEDRAAGRPKPEALSKANWDHLLWRIVQVIGAEPWASSTIGPSSMARSGRLNRACRAFDDGTPRT
jgi:hypothetical protein